MTTYRYRGQLIRNCSQTDIGPCTARGWYVQVYHAPTGMRHTEECCPHFASLREAKVWIDEDCAYHDWADSLDAEEPLDENGILSDWAESL